MEGNVGAGKSTLLNKAKENLDDIKRKTGDPTLELEIMIEPIGEWTDGEGNNFLEVINYLFTYTTTYIWLLLEGFLSGASTVCLQFSTRDCCVLLQTFVSPLL